METDEGLGADTDGERVLRRRRLVLRIEAALATGTEQMIEGGWSLRSDDDRIVNVTAGLATVRPFAARQCFGGAAALCYRTGSIDIYKPRIGICY